MKKLFLFVAVAGFLVSGQNVNAQSSKKAQKAQKVAKAERVYVSGKAQKASMKYNRASLDKNAVKSTNALSRKLSLSQTQSDKVLNINKSSAMRIESIRTSNADVNTMKAQLRTEYDNRDQAIRSVLDNTQVRLYNNMKQHAKELKGAMIKD